MYKHEEKKFTLKKRKNNLYLKKIVHHLNRLRSRMSQTRNEVVNTNTESEIRSGKVSKTLKKKNEFWRSYLEFIGLFQNSPEAMVYTDLNGIILETNKRFELLSGFGLREARGKYLKDLLDVNILQKNKNSHYFPGSEMKIKRKDGNNIYVSVSFASNLIEKEISGKILLLKDITNRKKNDDISNVLFNISRLASSNISLKELYPMIQQELHKIIDASNFFISLFDEEESKLRFCYHLDETGDKNKNSILFSNHQANNIFYYIFKTGKPLLLNYNKYKKMIRDGYFNSHDVITNKQIWLGVPLKIAEKPIGSIVLQNYTNPKLYSEKDIPLMEFVSQQIANAIEKKRAEKD